MMYWKLAIRNIRRSLRDYIIYFVTLTLTAALMYAFLALGFSSDVLAMAENMSILRLVFCLCPLWWRLCPHL